MSWARELWTKCTVTYHYNVAWPVLDGTKQAKDDDDNVEEIGQDWSPLVSQEIKNLSL